MLGDPYGAAESVPRDVSSLVPMGRTTGCDGKNGIKCSFLYTQSILSVSNATFTLKLQAVLYQAYLFPNSKPSPTTSIAIRVICENFIIILH